MRIYFHLSGRLGNQLFQWAYLHELSEQGHSIHLFVDKYHNDLSEPIYLNELLEECQHLTKVRTRNYLGLLLKFAEKLEDSNLKLRFLRKYIPVTFEDAFLGERRLPFVLDGFFINKSWPEKYKTILLKEFNALAVRKKVPLDSLVNIVNSQNTTLLHVRRGDLKKLKDSFGLLDQKYFKKCTSPDNINLILTDSFEDCRDMFLDDSSFHIINPTEVDVWGALVLMAESKKFIMSNSTLSWWGGYLALAKNNSDVLIPFPFYRHEGKFDRLLAVDGFRVVNSEFE